MGKLDIVTYGSFGNRHHTFSAMKNGHADAVAQAIEYLAAHLLPDATALDHKLHAQQQVPEEGFQRNARGQGDAETPQPASGQKNAT